MIFYVWITLDTLCTFCPELGVILEWLGTIWVGSLYDFGIVCLVDFTNLRTDNNLVNRTATVLCIMSYYAFPAGT